MTRKIMLGWRAALYRDSRGTDCDDETTPSLPILLVARSDDDPRCLSFLAHWLQRPEASRQRMPLLALVDPHGAVRPWSRRAAEDIFRPTAAAPEGGLPTETVSQAVATSSFAMVPGYIPKGEDDDPLLSAVRISSQPSFVVLDFTGGVAAVRLEGSRFSASRCGASLVVVGDGKPSPQAAACGWLGACAVAVDATASTILDAVAAVWSGRPQPLVAMAPLPALAARRCLVCSREVDGQPLTCGACMAVCFCDKACQLIEMTSEGALPHGACCASLATSRRCKSTWRVCVAHVEGDGDAIADGGSAWIAACWEGGGPTGMCSLLEGLGLHAPTSPYRALCSCKGGALNPDALLGLLSSCSKSAIVDAAAIAVAAPEASASRCTMGVPRDWSHAYQLLGLRADSPAALLLSLPLTLLHVLVSFALWPRDGGPPRTISVHWLGASAVCEGRLHAAFALLAAFVPPGSVIMIELIGPQLDMDTCPPPEHHRGANAGDVHVRFIHGLYHTMVSSDVAATPDGATAPLSTPDVIFAPNAGLVEYESWQPTIRHLLARNVQWAFSSYAQVEVDAARAHLWEAHGVAPDELTTTLNPFRSPLDEGRLIAGGALDFPWVSNALITRVR